MVMPYMPMLVPPINWTGYEVFRLAGLLSFEATSEIKHFGVLANSYCLLVYFGRYDRGAYLFLPSYVMRTHGAKQQREVVKRTPRKQLEPVFEV